MYQVCACRYEKDLGITLASLGPLHQDTASTYVSIGLVYCNVGQYRKAIEYHQKALDIRLAAIGAESPITASNYCNLVWGWVLVAI